MRTGKLKRIAAVVGLAILGIASAGCGAAQKPEPPVIRHIEIEGAKRFSKGAILEHVHAGETRRLPFTPDYPHDEALVAVDTRRILALYKAYGYYQAEVTSVRATPDEEGRRVDLRLTIDEGKPTTVGTLRFDWAASSSLDEPARRKVEARSRIRVGAPFEVEALNDSVGALRQDLRLRGHPLASTSVQVDVHEAARRADVVFSVDPGPHATIGSVRFEGLVEVPEYMLEREARFVLGEPFSPARVKQLERSIKAMRVFRWVTVLPPTTVVDGKAELTVRVSEADPQSIRLGAQALFEATRWEQLLLARYTHTNLFGHLTRLDLDVVGGWAELPDPWSPDSDGLVLSVTPAFTKKGLLEDYLLWSLRPTYEVDIQPGYKYRSPMNSVGVSRWFAGMLKLGLSHNLRRVDFFDLSPQLDAQSSLLGRDFRDPFTLSYLRFKAALYRVDSVRKPRNGFIALGTYDFAGGPFLGDYDFHQLHGELRGFLRPFKRLQIAARVQTGLILPYGADGGAPFAFKLYLGGATTVRGWGSRRLSPRLEECDEDGACDSVPIGGQTLIHGTLELRYNAFGDLYLVAFADMGDVQAGEATYVTSEWNYSAGPGLRYDSPIGLVRLDVGFRLNDPGVYPGEPGWGLYFGLGEAF